MISIIVPTVCTNLGQVHQLDLKRILRDLVRPYESLRFEPKQNRERQVAAAAAVETQEAARAQPSEMMKALQQSKAAHFLGAISREMRKRGLQTRDVFEDVDRGRTWGLGKLSMMYANFLSHPT